MSTEIDTIHRTMTLDEITNRFPETIVVFNTFGMDICCGGGESLAAAAERDGVALATIEAELRRAAATDARSGG